MDEFLGARFQGGPFDGLRRTLRWPEPPDLLWVLKCPSCGAHVFGREVGGGVLYRYDETHAGQHLYVYTDENLATRLPELVATVD